MFTSGGRFLIGQRGDRFPESHPAVSPLVRENGVKSDRARMISHASLPSPVTLLKIIEFSQTAIDVIKTFLCLAFLVVLGFGTVGAIFYLLYLGFL